MNVSRVITEHWSCAGRVERPGLNSKVVTFREERNVTCLCNCCGAWLVFQAHREGEMVNCPQCFMGTILYLPEQGLTQVHSDLDFEFRKIRWDASGYGTRCITGEL